MEPTRVLQDISAKEKLKKLNPASGHWLGRGLVVTRELVDLQGQHVLTPAGFDLGG